MFPDNWPVEACLAVCVLTAISLSALGLLFIYATIARDEHRGRLVAEKAETRANNVIDDRTHENDVLKRQCAQLQAELRDELERKNRLFVMAADVLRETADWQSQRKGSAACADCR